MMRIEAEEINLLDEWIFPEQKDPHVELSVKILSILKAEVKEYNKAGSDKTNLKELKQAFIAGASNCNLKDSELLKVGFERVRDFLNGKSKSFKKENFAIQQDSESKVFEIVYADNENPSEEIEDHGLSDYKVDNVEELYLEDYKTCTLNERFEK
jgi:hypothetical protein